MATKLRRKTLSIVGITIAALTGILYVASSSILLGSLIEAEEQEATQVVKGVLQRVRGNRRRLQLALCRLVVVGRHLRFYPKPQLRIHWLQFNSRRAG